MNGHIGEWFQIITAVRQGCILSPILFAITIGWVMRRTTHNGAGITWVDGKKLKNLDFTDDIALICENHADSHTYS
jgi:hypothetical protein